MKKILRPIMALMALSFLAAASSGCTAKMKKAYHESRADKFYAAGQFDRAEIEYLNVLRNDNANAKAFARLGYIYFDQGRFQTAAPYLMHASMLATNDLDVRLKLGLVYASAGRMKEARDEADFVLNRNPQLAEAPLLLVQSVRTNTEVAVVRAQLEKLAQAGDRADYEVALGTLAFRDNDAKTAEADFRRALTLDAKSADAYESLGALQSTRNNVKEAEVNFKQAADLSPARSTKRMNYARFKLQTGDTAGANQILADVVQQAPDYIPALMGLAEIALDEKKFDECQANLTKVLARDPDNFDGLMLTARLQFSQGDVPGATATLEKMARLYPQAPRVHYQLGAVYLAGGDDTKATVSLNEALQLDPNFDDAVLLLAQIQIKNQNPDPAIVALGNVVKKHPQYVRAQLLLADAYRQRGRGDEALAIYAAMEKLAPNNPQVPLLAGAALLAAGDRGQARQKFERALTVDPGDLPALEQVVDLDLGETNYAGARQLVQAKLDQAPTNTVLQLLVAKVQLAAGNQAEGEQTLLKAAETAPQNEEPHLMLAQLYFDEKQQAKAVAELQAAISRNPKNISAMMLLATSSEAAKDYKDAAATYEQALALNPKCSPALNNLAYLYSEYLNQPDRAYELAQSARVLLPFDPATADTLGWICLKRGQYPTALALLQESGAKLPNVPEAQYHFGMASYMTSDEASARAAFQAALAGGQEFNGREECQLCLTLLDINPQTADAGARDRLEKRVGDKPEDPVAQGRLGAIYVRDGKADQAIACYEAVLKTDDKNLAAMNQLVRLYETKDMAKAYAMARAAYKLDPNSGLTAHAYGRLAYQNGDYDVANTMLQAAVQNQPDDAVAQFDYARAAYSMGKVDVAQTALQAAMAGNLPATAAGEAKRMADLVAEVNAPPAAAAAQVADVLKAEPNYVPALMVQARLDEQARDATAAAAACEKILAQFQNFVPAQRELAILYSKDGTKSDKAYALAMKARLTYPDDPALMKAIGIIIFQRGDYSRAASLLSDCAAKMGEDPEIYYYLGAAQYQLKNRAAGQASLQQALALKLSGPLADSARQMLNNNK